MNEKRPFYPELIHIGNNVHIVSGVSFLTHDKTCNVVNGLEEAKESRGNAYERIVCIDIRDNVWIGSGVRILYDTRIGPNAIISTGSIVVHNVLCNIIVAGIPARVVGKFDEYVDRMINNPMYPLEMRPKKSAMNW